MKTTTILGLTLLSLNTWAQTKPLNLKGNTSATGKVYLQKFNNKMFTTIDSTEIENGQFKFNTKVELPELYGIALNKDKSPLYVFLEDNPIEVSLDSLNYYKKSVISGSTNQTIFENYKKTKTLKIDSFIRQNPNSLATAYVLYREWSYRLSPEEIQKNIDLLDKSLHNTKYVQVLKALIPTLKSVQPGNKAIEFALPDTENRITKLSSHYGKYILVDFWASWCPPCRAENPNVVKAFNNYKNKNFTVFGVSLDKNKENWLKAIKDDQLNWTQVSDLKFWNSEGAKIYGVRAIPANVLIDPNGIIVARNLYGDELEKKLAELLQ